MIRVAGLRHQRDNHVMSRDIAHMTPVEQLENISETCQKLVAKQYVLFKSLVAALAKEGIFFVKPESLNDEEKSGLRIISKGKYFLWLHRWRWILRILFHF